MHLHRPRVKFPISPDDDRMIGRGRGRDQGGRSPQTERIRRPESMRCKCAAEAGAISQDDGMFLAPTSHIGSGIGKDQRSRGGGGCLCSINELCN